MATTQTISIYRGEVITLDFAMSPVPEGGIDGWTLAFTVARSRNSAVKLIEKVPGVVDAMAGTFRVILDAVDSEGIHPGAYYFDVWRTDEGEERVLALGPFEVRAVARIGD